MSKVNSKNSFYWNCVVNLQQIQVWNEKKVWFCHNYDWLLKLLKADGELWLFVQLRSKIFFATKGFPVNCANINPLHIFDVQIPYILISE